MRTVIAAALLFVFPAGALAQDTMPIETIQSDGLDTLTGIWKFAFPSIRFQVSMPLMGRASGTYDMGNSFCRVTHEGGDAASVNCLGDMLGEGTATLEKKKLHIAWGSMMLRIFIDTKLENSAAFSGLFGFKLMGIQHDADAPVTGQRFTVAQGAPDSAGKAGLVSATLAQLAAGATITQNSTLAWQHLAEATNTSAEIAALGKPEAALYVGEGTSRLPPAKKGDPAPPPLLYSVYQVEFAGGQRLCAIRLGGDGALDGFLCV